MHNNDGNFCLVVHIMYYAIIMDCSVLSSHYYSEIVSPQPL